jgi:SpoIIAA-like
MSYRHNPCYSESMPIGLEQEADSIFRIEMRGMLRKADLDRCQARLAAEMSRLGPVRLLFVLDGFAGWEPRDNWSDLTFYAKYNDRIDRIAIVGDERWRSEALMFAGAELRRAPVEYFAGSSREDGGARAWLSA